jgi:hypothetical protein
MNIKPASGLVAWCLKMSNFHGACLPPFGIYILPNRLADEGLIRHEKIHWAQYQRMGAIRYYLTYVWQVLRYGYWNAPMEREARGEING